MLDAITSGATNSASRADASAASLADDFTTFLTLLTTQLQNQDPLDPLDSNEFTQQLVQFTGVEQQIQANANLEELANLTRQNNLAGVAGFLGQEAVIPGDTGTHESRGIRFEVGIFSAPDQVRFDILDSSGTAVLQTQGEAVAGLQTFDWDGRDALGNLLPEGRYTLRVSAEADGEALASEIFVQDQITQIETAGEQPLLTIAGRPVPQDALLRLVAGRTGS